MTGRLVRLNAFCARHHSAILSIALLAIMIVIFMTMPIWPAPSPQGCANVPDAATGEINC